MATTLKRYRVLVRITRGKSLMLNLDQCVDCAATPKRMHKAAEQYTDALTLLFGAGHPQSLSYGPLTSEVVITRHTKDGIVQVAHIISRLN